MDISQESAIKACLQNGDGLASKVSTAYDKCFGTDYDFDEFAEKDDGPDGDSDGLSDTFEGKEMLESKRRMKKILIKEMRHVSTKRWVGLMILVLWPRLSRLTWKVLMQS